MVKRISNPQKEKSKWVKLREEMSDFSRNQRNANENNNKTHFTTIRQPKVRQLDNIAWRSRNCQASLWRM